MSALLPLEHRRRGPGRPRLSDEERARRKQLHEARRAAELAAVAPRLFTVAAAARYASLSPWTIRTLLASGVLQRVVIPADDAKDLRVIRIDRDDLDRCIAAWKANAR